MCLAPCFKGCTDERYQEESSAVEQFMATRGESRLATLRAERDEASTDLDFERAATLHAQVQRAETVRALAPELVRPMSRLRAVILQAGATADEVAVFLFEGGLLRGPAAFSTIGMRIQNEQSGSSSLFAQPMAIEPIPEASPAPAATTQGFVSGHDLSRADSAAGEIGALAPEGESALQQATVTATPAKVPRSLLESRMEAALSALAEATPIPTATQRQGHLALLKRWYYRPEVRRAGEIFFPDAEDHWPLKAMLRGAGRVAAKMLMSTGKPA